MRGYSIVFPFVLALGITATPGCADPPSEPPRAEAMALFEGNTDADTPWPSDAFLVDGKVRLTSLPLRGDSRVGPKPVAALAASLSELDGAPTYTSVFFPTSTLALPQGPVAGRALYVDLDQPDARVLESALFFRASTKELVALAPTGGVLSAGHRHACVVTSPVVRPSTSMLDAIRGTGPQAAIFRGLAERLGHGLPSLDEVSAATVFTVGRPVAMTEKMRDVAATLPPPRAVVTRSYRHGAELDEVFGTPTTTRPGIGDPKGITHDALDRAVFGTFEAPSFLTATPPRLGMVETDAGGNPRVKGTATIPFLLTLPAKPPGGWPAAGVPVLVFQHGLNASRAQVAAVANDYARAGFATIGIDALGHGDRSAFAKDERHNFTGAQGPDGLADGDAFGASITLFDFQGESSAGIGVFDPRAVRDNFRQAVVDLTVFARLLAHGDLSAIAASDPTDLAGLKLDTSRLVYTGESFGSILGIGALAVSPDLGAAALSVGGGGIFLNMMARSPIFARLVTPFVQAAFDTTLDVSDPVALPPDAQRSLALLQAAIMPGDPLAFAPLLEARQKRLLLLQARADEAIPNESGELLATATGATFVELPERSAPPRFSALPAVRAPWAVSTPAFVQLSPALHTMFTSFEDVRRTDPETVPLVRLPAPQRVDNPIELAHRVALQFASTYRAGAPRIEP